MAGSSSAMMTRGLMITVTVLPLHGCSSRAARCRRAARSAPELTLDRRGGTARRAGRPPPGVPRAGLVGAVGAVCLELAVERLAIETERLRGERAVSADRLENVQDVALLDFLERDELGRVAGRHDHV